VDATTTPTLLKLVAEGKLTAEKLITHGELCTSFSLAALTKIEFNFSDMIEAYTNFRDAASNKTLKVLIKM
jgi:threonine dehydrogenase-like Zn-dependent dehydrogenase